MEVGKGFGSDALVSDDHEGLGVLVYDHLSGDNGPLNEYIRWASQVHEGEDGTASVQKVDSLVEYLDHEPIHMAFSGRCAKMADLEKALKAELKADVKIFGTVYSELDFTLIDVVNPSASKGAGVAAAAAELDLMPEEVMAIGDNFNDLEMLLFAGTGVVMANAPQALRETQGLYPTASNKDDGVALAIEQFILGKADQ
jgi:hydroxymethylpyrimidine pyrophosphatase-like HAD family hydrolase